MEHHDPLRSFVHMHEDPELISQLEQHLDFANANADEAENPREYNMLVASSIIKEIGIEQAQTLVENGQFALKMLLAQVVIEFFAVLTPDEINECLEQLAHDVEQFRDDPDARPTGMTKAMEVADAFRTALEMAEVEASIA